MTEPVNLLKPFLFESLPAGFELNDGEMLTDALVIVRIMDPADGAERLEYVATRSLSIYMARGMLDDVTDRVKAVMTAAADVGVAPIDDDDDEGVS